MSKNKLLAAKELIQEKRYAEARAILKTIDHPTAREWLKKLDEIAPDTEKKDSSLNTILIAGSAALLLMIGFVIVFLVVRPFPPQTASSIIDTETATERPPNLTATLTPTSSATATVTQTATVTSTPLPTRTRIPTATSTATMIPQIQQLGPIADAIYGEIYSVEIWLTGTEFVSNQELRNMGREVVAAFVVVRNLGPGTMRSVNDSNFQIRDGNGALRSTTYVGNCSFDYVDLTSGGNIQGCVAFEVPLEGSLELIYAPYQSRQFEPGRYISFTIR